MYNYLPDINEVKPKVYDLYLDGKGIFHYMNEISPLPFGDFVDITTMDLTFITFYGDRQLSGPIKNIIKDTITPEKLQQIASMLYGLYSSKWASLYDIYNEKLDLDSYRMTTTETVLDDGETSVAAKFDNTNTATNQVTGYNSEDWADATKDTSIRNDTSTNTGTKTNTKSVESDVRGNMSNRIEDRNKALDTLSREVINDVVYKDTAQLVGSLIF